METHPATAKDPRARARLVPLGEREARAPVAPKPLTPLVGRQDALHRLEALLLDGQYRLVTLIGPGGIGKTRLAMEVAARVADRFLDGVAFVSLASVSQPDLVGPAIVESLGINVAGGEPVDQALRAWLRRRQVLLVLDNFEQVADAAPLVIDLLKTCADCTILVTSRVPLNLTRSGEQVFRVPPLDVPDAAAFQTTDEIGRTEAVSLFVQRARAIRPSFALTDMNAHVVGEICARLGGSPLAIELAASRIKVLSPEALLARLEQRFSLLAGHEPGIPDRHQSIGQTLTWSFELLPADARTLARMLAVFPGAFRLDAVEGIAAELAASGEADGGSPAYPPGAAVLDALSVLVDSSVVERLEDVNHEASFVMVEAVREFAERQLAESGDAERVQDAHIRWFRRYALDCLVLIGTRFPDRGWNLLASERVNLEAAFRRACGRDEAAVLDLGAALCVLWQNEAWELRLYERDFRAWAEVVRSSSIPVPALYQSLMLVSEGVLGGFAGRADEHIRLARRSAEIAREIGHQWALGNALNCAAYGMSEWGDQEAAIAALEEALAIWRRIEARRDIAVTLNNLGYCSFLRGDLARARAMTCEAIEHACAVTKLEVACTAVGTLAEIDIAAGQRSEAYRSWSQALDWAWKAGNDHVLVNLIESVAAGLAEVAPAATARAFGAADTLHDQSGLARPTVYQEENDRAMERARALAGDGEIDRAYAAGRTSPLRAIIRELRALCEAEARSGAASPNPLSPRERDVLRLVVEGRSDREIGEALFVSRRTAASHVASILEKLGVTSRTAAAAEAVRRGLV